jgi:Ca2+-binding RTX toxin-like protein
MAFTTLSAGIFVVQGRQFAPGSDIPAGTTLTRATLTTIDEDTGPIGPLAIQSDPYNLLRGEAVSFRVNGQEISSVVPSMVLTTLVTDAGSIRALSFTIDGNTYFLPQTNAPIDDVTTTIAASRLGTSPVSLQASSYGLLPENADTFAGQVYSETKYGDFLSSKSVRDVSLYDADGIRGNADSVGEEIALFNVGLTTSGPPILPVGEASEIFATLRFNDGATLGVDAVATFASGPYGESTSRYLFDSDALVAAGRTLSDIAQVVSFARTDHDLNWADLGFRLLSEGGGTATPDPAPAAPINQVNGTNGRDALVGTAGRDVLAGRAGADTLTGGEGNDAFLFGAETRNGRRETDRITDYEVGQDIIAFADGVTVTGFRNISGGVQITFGGDGDRVQVFGDDLTTATIRIFADDNIPSLL